MYIRLSTEERCIAFLRDDEDNFNIKLSWSYLKGFYLFELFSLSLFCQFTWSGLFAPFNKAWVVIELSA